MVAILSWPQLVLCNVCGCHIASVILEIGAVTDKDHYYNHSTWDSLTKQLQSLVHG